MQTGTIVIINDIIGAVQSVDGVYLNVLCDDGKIRKIVGKPTEIASPHAMALLYYDKLLKRISR